MAEENDLIFREVNEDLRRDRLQAFWQQYGRYIITFTILIIVMVGVVSVYQARERQLDEAASEKYNQMLSQLDARPLDIRLILEGFIAQDHRGYNVLAQFLLAQHLAEAGKLKEAAAQFNRISENGAVPLGLREFARLQAAIAVLEDESVEALRARLQPLLMDGNKLAPAARELLAIALMTDEQYLEARTILLTQLADPGISPATRLRAEILSQDTQAALGRKDAKGAAEEQKEN